MKKALKAILKVIVLCAILGGLGYGGYRIYLSRQAKPAASDGPGYVKMQIGTGDLQKTVTGTGTLSISKTQDVSVRFPVQVANVRVLSGEQVTVGTPLMDVDRDALSNAIATLETELETAESNLAQLIRSHSDEKTLTISAAGRVKAIYGSVGELAQDVMEKYGALMLLSMDGKMKVTIDAGDLKVGKTVTVMDGLSKYEGTVESITDGKALITFSDIKTLEGANVQVTMGSVILGSGTAQINMPYLYTTTEQGRISKIYPSINSKVGRRASLFYLTQLPVSSEYDAAVRQRNDILEKLKEAREVLKTGAIVSPIDGIVSSIVSASASETEANTALATLYVGDAMQMIISVDELDIIGVKVGQPVSIAMDAIPDKTYDATVSYISQIGSSSSGVTTYSVTLDVQGDDKLKIGMNGTATITVGEVKDVVLVPIVALNTSRNGQYVWLYNGSDSSGSQEPGIRTVVETGMSNETYAEVKSGLKEGDIVLVTRNAATDSLQNMMFMPMQGMPQMPGGQGGQMPNFPRNNMDGGGTRNPGGGFQRPGN